MHAVLVVDDDPITLEALEALLALDGCLVVAAETAEAALEQLRRDGDICCVLTDWRMPGSGGAGLLAEARRGRLLEHVPVVVMTADGLTEAQARAAGATALLRKPVDPTVVLSVVQRHCRFRRPHRGDEPGQAASREDDPS